MFYVQRAKILMRISQVIDKIIKILDDLWRVLNKRSLQLIQKKLNKMA